MVAAQIHAERISFFSAEIHIEEHHQNLDFVYISNGFIHHILILSLLR